MLVARKANVPFSISVLIRQNEFTHGFFARENIPERGETGTLLEEAHRFPMSSIIKMILFESKGEAGGACFAPTLIRTNVEIYFDLQQGRSCLYSVADLENEKIFFSLFLPE